MISVDSHFEPLQPISKVTLAVKDTIVSPVLCYSSSINKETLKSLDEATKVTLAAVLKTVTKTKSDSGSQQPFGAYYDELCSSLANLPLLETKDGNIKRESKQTRHYNEFKPGSIVGEVLSKGQEILSSGGHSIPEDSLDTKKGSKKSKDTNMKNINEVVPPAKVYDWFTELVDDDQEILEAVNLKFIEELLGWAGLNFKKICKNSEPLPALEMVILRFPSSQRKEFTLIKISLRCWAQFEITKVSETQKSGLTGEYVTKHFLPRTSVITSLKEEVKSKVISEIEAIFN